MEQQLLPGQYMMQTLKIAMEYFRDERFYEELAKFKKENGLDLYYYTLAHDDYKRMMVTLKMFGVGHRTTVLHVTAPADHLISAISWVYDNNPHLIFDKTTKPFTGYNADDFMHNRLTARLPFVKIPDAKEMTEDWEKFLNRPADIRRIVK